MTLASNTILQLFKRWIALSTEDSFNPWNYPIDTANYQMVWNPATYLLDSDFMTGGHPAIQCVNNQA